MPKAPASPPDTYCAGLPDWKRIFLAPDPRTAAARLPQILEDALVNGSSSPTSVQPVCLPSGRLALSADDWTSLGFKPTQKIVLPDGRQVFALESIPGATYEIDSLDQNLKITVPPVAFDASHLDLSHPTGKSSAPPWGGYVTYDTNFSYANRSLVYGANLAATVFGPLGLFTTTATVSGAYPGRVSAVRGDTYWQLPSVENASLLVVGDTAGVGGAWSRAIRFGGIRYSRDFDTEPGFVTFPMPTVGGSAALPSTINVLVNNVQRMTLNVPAGPFDIRNIPVLSGPGQVQLVVTDQLGRQSVITQNFFSSNQLLKAGITDFSYEAGFERLNYGTEDFDYGHFVADATYRRGLTDSLTVEGRVEAEANRGAAGVALWTNPLALGALEASAAYSYDANGKEGGNFLVGFQTLGGHAGVSTSLQYFTPGYRPFAYAPGETLPKLQATAEGSFGFHDWGVFNLGYVYASQYRAASSEFVNAGWSKSFGRRLSLSVYGSRDLISSSWSVSMTLGFSLGRNSGSASVNSSGGATTETVQVTSPAPTGEGFGWSVRAGTDTDGVEASGIYNGRLAAVSADVAAGRGGEAVRLGASGSIGMVAGYPFASRAITSGFAVVRTGGVAGAPVLLWNQPAAVTGRNGIALVTGLGPFVDNRISIDPSVLPLDVEIDGDTVSARVWPGAGAFINFPIRRSRSALVVLRLANGAPVPLGAVVSLKPGGPTALVAQRGEVWLTDLQDQNTLTVTWNQGACSAALTAPKTLAPDATLGPVACAAKPSH